MRSRVLILAVAFFLLLFMALYFLINPSYEKSLKAKYYYEIGEYKEALVFAKEAFSMDIYNRMASTVMAQSITSLKYVTYIEEARAFMQDINKIATHEVISNADKAKIRTICEIMISSYKKLAPSVVTDKELVKQAAKYHKDFEKLLEKVSK
ncbi:hypothetical protein M947_04560 [Sulfurimonas hongkongensis]|uniref:Uncharacterized protein n=1 Tax=Sulfurimonas hongkongensis TaxID=1172190 RepID=T0JFN7_9BACT|nr:hypothetical protein [Sulfurimonas hongkongensis]EQB39855.1 hypothetical protein M947_04560 [Sulfurimonas hongkongensis]